MRPTLTSRQARTVIWLLDQNRPRSMADAASELRLSPRVVRSGLDGIDRYLRSFDASLGRRRGVGIWIEGSGESLAEVRSVLNDSEGTDTVAVYAAADRLHVVLFELLVSAPDPLTVERIQHTLQVSLTSARRDLTRAEPWLDSQGLFLARRPGLGVSVVGTETAIRRSLVKLLLETVPESLLQADAVAAEWWRSPEISAGVRQFLERLPVGACHAIVRRNEQVRSRMVGDYPWLAADLAVTAFRIRTGKPLKPEAGALRSLVDHPMWESAQAVAEELETLVGAPLDDEEIAGITEHLLGLARLDLPNEHAPEPSDTAVRLATGAVAIASDELHPGIAEDPVLLRSLTEHIERLDIRIRYGLPVHNPLLAEVSERYPDVHELAVRVADYLGEELGARLSADEAGFITMYLSGALERLRLKPRTRTVIVCPTGVATAWILVSRIQAEFPELDLVEVLSAGSIERTGEIDADLIISTVAIEDDRLSLPVLVVSPLLPAEDVRRVARLL